MKSQTDRQTESIYIFGMKNWGTLDLLLQGGKLFDFLPDFVKLTQFISLVYYSKNVLALELLSNVLPYMGVGGYWKN